MVKVREIQTFFFCVYAFAQFVCSIRLSVTTGITNRREIREKRADLIQ